MPVNKKKANQFKQINAEDAHQFRKGKSISNDNTEQQQTDTDVDQATSIYFQDELVTKILIRLPVRYIHQAKCVSKSWETLISNPYFKKKHQILAKKDLNSRKFLVNCYRTGEKRLFNFNCSLSSAEDLQKLNCPSIRPTIFKFYGSYDGLVLLGIYEGLAEQLWLWNPSTSESVQLPHPNQEYGKRVCTFGLGYDATSDDYKILQIHIEEGAPRTASIEILTLKSGSWRKLCYNPNGIYPTINIYYRMDPLAFVHGAFHWLGRDYSVVTFSISDEVYGKISLLEHMYNADDHDDDSILNHCGVSVLEGMLCFYSNYGMRQKGTFKLWGMKDYAIKESWTELFTIQICGLDGAKPIYMFADGDVLLHCSTVSNRDVFRTSKGPFGLLPRSNAVLDGIVFTESLISPKSLF